MTEGRPRVDARAEARGRLTVMRAELVKWLVRDGVEGGTLALIAGVNAAIEAIDATAEAPADAAGIGRVVVSDDGRGIRLTPVSLEAGVITTVALDPVRAIRLAAKLITAALPS